jgi:hypothetical protein
MGNERDGILLEVGRTMNKAVNGVTIFSSISFLFAKIVSDPFLILPAAPRRDKFNPDYPLARPNPKKRLWRPPRGAAMKAVF